MPLPRKAVWGELEARTDIIYFIFLNKINTYIYTFINIYNIHYV